MPTSTGLDTKKMDRKRIFIYKKMKTYLIVLFLLFAQQEHGHRNTRYL